MKTSVILLLLGLTSRIALAQTTAAAGNTPKKEQRKEQLQFKSNLIRMEGREVSERARQQFAADFNETSGISWKRQPYYDQVSFTNTNGQKMDAYYDISGKLIGTTSAASYKDLPPAGQRKIAEHYKNYDHAPVLFYDDNSDNDTDMYLYGTAFEDSDAYFIRLTNKKGKLVILKIDTAGKVIHFSGVAS